MNSICWKKQKRHGFTFVELLVAIILVGVTLALVAKMLSISLQQNLTSQRRLANVEIANSVFEIISALPYDNLDDFLLNRPEFSQIIGPGFDKWVLEFNVTEVAVPAPGKRLELSVLPVTENKSLRPYLLVGWRFAEPFP